MTEAYTIRAIPERLATTVRLPASKSLSNRALILQALSQNQFSIEALSDAGDTRLLAEHLQSGKNTWDCGNAGTVMRFLTAYAALIPGRQDITGNNRMLERPIGPLVQALNQLGASIDFLGGEGYPPVRVNNQTLDGGHVTMDAGVSSQFVTALLLIAPFTKHGIQLTFTGIPVSRPYFSMTIKLLQYFNVKVQQKSNEVAVSPKKQWPDKPLAIEPDWSSAAYWVGLAGLLKGSQVTFPNLPKRSWQGDQAILDLASGFGIRTQKQENALTVYSQAGYPAYFEGFLTDHPDLVPTLVALCTAAHVPFRMLGIAHLKDKETDRLKAMQAQMRKAGAAIEILDNGLACEAYGSGETPLTLETYDDHRMALSGVILAASHLPVIIKAPAVVDKSYPGFWDQLRAAGFTLSPTT